MADGQPKEQSKRLQWLDVAISVTSLAVLAPLLFNNALGGVHLIALHPYILLSIVAVDLLLRLVSIWLDKDQQKSRELMMRVMGLIPDICFLIGLVLAAILVVHLAPALLMLQVGDWIFAFVLLAMAGNNFYRWHQSRVAKESNTLDEESGKPRSKYVLQAFTATVVALALLATSFHSPLIKSLMPLAAQQWYLSALVAFVIAGIALYILAVRNDWHNDKNNADSIPIDNCIDGGCDKKITWRDFGFVAGCAVAGAAICHVALLSMPMHGMAFLFINAIVILSGLVLGQLLSKIITAYHHTPDNQAMQKDSIERSPLIDPLPSNVLTDQTAAEKTVTSGRDGWGCFSWWSNEITKPMCPQKGTAFDGGHDFGCKPPCDI